MTNYLCANTLKQQVVDCFAKNGYIEFGHNRVIADKYI